MLRTASRRQTFVTFHAPASVRPRKVRLACHVPSCGVPETRVHAEKGFAVSVCLPEGLVTATPVPSEGPYLPSGRKVNPLKSSFALNVTETDRAAPLIE